MLNPIFFCKIDFSGTTPKEERSIPSLHACLGFSSAAETILRNFCVIYWLEISYRLGNVLDDRSGYRV
jgi:hypothetical protein